MTRVSPKANVSRQRSSQAHIFHSHRHYQLIVVRALYKMPLIVAFSRMEPILWVPVIIFFPHTHSVVGGNKKYPFPPFAVETRLPTNLPHLPQVNAPRKGGRQLSFHCLAGWPWDRSLEVVFDFRPRLDDRKRIREDGMLRKESVSVVFGMR